MTSHPTHYKCITIPPRFQRRKHKLYFFRGEALEDLRPDFKTTPATLVKLYRILEILINNLKK
jgi:hypothetical protein